MRQPKTTCHVKHDMAVFALKGTFLVRPGLSLAGCMVISAAVAGGGCKHMALDGTQLQSRSLEVSVPPNADVLIPEYSHCTLTSVSSIPSLFSAASDMYAAWLTHLNDSCDVGPSLLCLQSGVCFYHQLGVLLRIASVSS